MIPSATLEAKIAELLDAFYAKRSAALSGLKLTRALQRKNPYLYRAAGIEDASEIVDEILRAYTSSSDETLFGNEFFEPLAKWVAEESNAAVSTTTVTTSDGEGVDITITTATSVMPIAVKSGTNVFNAASKKKQGENFRSLGKRLHKLGKHFDPVVGYCYGRKKQSPKSSVAFRELAGEAFWETLTGEKGFYLRVVQLMQDKPVEHRPEFQAAYGRAKNRFVAEFLDTFALPDGGIDWDSLVRMNSGVAAPIRRRKTSVDVVEKLAELIDIA